MGIFKNVMRLIGDEKNEDAAKERIGAERRAQAEKRRILEQEAARIELAKPYLKLVEEASAALDTLLADRDFVAYFTAVKAQLGDSAWDSLRMDAKTWRGLRLFSMYCGTSEFTREHALSDHDNISWVFWLNTETTDSQERFILQQSAPDLGVSPRLWSSRTADWGTLFMPESGGRCRFAEVRDELEQTLEAMRSPELMLRYLFRRFGEPSHYGL